MRLLAPFLLAFTLAADPAPETLAKRLAEYIRIRQQVNGQLPPASKKATPAEIEQREIALANAIRKARPQAKQGDIFVPEVKAFFDGLFKGAFTGAAGDNRRENVKDGNPKVEQEPGQVVPVLQVNAVYPKNASLSTVPPSLLMKLPKLPPDLEYRFVGRTMILRDSQSNLIVDFLPEAVPAR